MAAGGVAITSIAGVGLLLESEPWGLLFLVAVPLFVYFGWRGWRHGLRF